MKYVKVKQGMIEGLQQHGYCVFKGIPFAKPPIGNLRWKAPHPADAWEGVYYADHFKYRGWQENDTQGEVPFWKEKLLKEFYDDYR